MHRTRTTFNAPQLVALVGLVAMLLAGCGDSPDETFEPATAPNPSNAEQLYPDVVAVEISQDGEGTYRLDVTVSSPYDTPERYADAWRVLAPDGSELGVRELTHDHANEQPFTRSLTGVEIPSGVTEVTVQGRDLVNGWGGMTATVEVPR